VAAAIAIFVLGGITAGSLRPGNVPPTTSGNQSRALVANAAAPQISVADAQNAVRAAESAYLSALTRYTELAGTVDVVDPVARLAALESIVLTTRAALGQAPADPVINGYHLTAVAQRDATMKKLAMSSGNQTWF
jgi:hypothetical protein